MAAEGYETRDGAVFLLQLHVIWCPKYRRPVLVGDVANRLKVLLAEKAAERGWTVEALEVMPDHVHVFVRHGPTASAAYVANQFKGYTSRVLRREFRSLRSRLPTLWSKSYFASSVGRVSAETVRRYVDEQTTRPTKGRP